MNLKIAITIFIWFAIISGLALAAIGLYNIGFNNNPSYALPLLIIGLVIFIVGVIFYIRNERKNKVKDSRLTKTQKKSVTKNSTLDEGEIITINQSLIESPQIKSQLKAIKIISPPTNEVCMISKLPIEKDDRILQCPYCQSYFIKNYLEKWIEENKNCPVCQNPLI